jgi:hypothetical protein
MDQEFRTQIALGKVYGIHRPICRARSGLGLSSSIYPLARESSILNLAKALDRSLCMAP